jgi:hypothetical protein
MSELFFQPNICFWRNHVAVLLTIHLGVETVIFVCLDYVNARLQLHFKPPNNINVEVWVAPCPCSLTAQHDCAGAPPSGGRLQQPWAACGLVTGRNGTRSVDRPAHVTAAPAPPPALPRACSRAPAWRCRRRWWQKGTRRRRLFGRCLWRWRGGVSAGPREAHVPGPARSQSLGCGAGPGTVPCRRCAPARAAGRGRANNWRASGAGELPRAHVLPFPRQLQPAAACERAVRAPRRPVIRGGANQSRGRGGSVPRPGRRRARQEPPRDSPTRPTRARDFVFVAVPVSCVLGGGGSQRATSGARWRRPSPSGMALFLPVRLERQRRQGFCRARARGWRARGWSASQARASCLARLQFSDLLPSANRLLAC